MHHFSDLQQIYSGNVYQISSVSLEFYRRYYKKHVGLFFTKDSTKTTGMHVLIGLLAYTCMWQ